MVKPTKPTVPAPALRSDPDTFAARAETNILFWETFNDYQDEIADFVDERADDAVAAAIGGDLPALTGHGGKLLAAKADETGAEFVDAITAIYTDVAGAAVTAATELLILTDGNYITITGDGTVTSIETTANAIPVGREIDLYFSGTVTFTHHATNLICPGGGDITFTAGDRCKVRKYASGDWEVLSVSKSVPPYEEGTWTPEMRGTVSTGITHSTQNGRYIRNGNQVTLFWEVVISSKGSATNNVAVHGLPFSADASLDNYVGTIGSTSSMTITAGESVGCTLNDGVSYIFLELWDSTSGDSYLQWAEVQDSFQHSGYITYRTDDP